MVGGPGLLSGPWKETDQIVKLCHVSLLLSSFTNYERCCQDLPTLMTSVVMLSSFANYEQFWQVLTNLYKTIQFSQPWTIISGIANSGLPVIGPTGHTESRSRWTQVARSGPEVD